MVCRPITFAAVGDSVFVELTCLPLPNICTGNAIAMARFAWPVCLLYMIADFLC